jgi:hypothetical protein
LEAALRSFCHVERLNVAAAWIVPSGRSTSSFWQTGQPPFAGRDGFEPENEAPQ